MSRLQSHGFNALRPLVPAFVDNRIHRIRGHLLGRIGTDQLLITYSLASAAVLEARIYLDQECRSADNYKTLSDSKY